MLKIIRIHGKNFGSCDLLRGEGLGIGFVAPCKVMGGGGGRVSGLPSPLLPTPMFYSRNTEF